MASIALESIVAKWEETTGGREPCLVVVRHGATIWNAERRLQGRRDIPLSSQGLMQADEAAQALRALPRPVGVYCSPLRRAHATALAIARTIAAPIYICQDLVERSYGAMEGMTTQEMDSAFPRRRQDETSVPGLEPYPALQTRAASAFRTVADSHPGDLVIVVSHGALINAFLSVATAGQLGTGVTDLANGSISVVWQDMGKWRVAAANVTAHLSAPTGQTVAPPRSDRPS